MRILTMALLVGFLLGGTDDKTVKLELLPTPEKGKEEKIEIDATFGRPNGAEYEKKTVTGTLRRKIKSLDDDGLSARETLTLETATFKSESMGENGGWSTSSNLNQPWSETLKREGKARRVKVDTLPGTGSFPLELGFVLRDDPDGLVRAILPEGEVSKGEEWSVEPAKLLLVLGPSKARLSEKSKATATLSSLKKGEAVVTLEAVLRFTTTDDPDDEKRLGVTLEVRGAIDGSAPPRKETLVLTSKKKDPSGKKDATIKETTSVTFTREWAEKEDEKDADENKDADKDKKDKKDEKEKK